MENGSSVGRFPAHRSLYQPTVDLPVTDLAGRWGGPPRDGSHVHHAPFDRIDVQLFPCGLATATPQTFTVAS
jgi:hypothetical protein